MLELGREADHGPQRAERIVLTELDNGQGPAAGARIVESDTLHRAKAQRFDPALGHHLDRHAALEIGRVGLPILERGLSALDQPLDEGVILLLVYRAVAIILASADRPPLVPAAPPSGHAHLAH